MPQRKEVRSVDGSKPKDAPISPDAKAIAGESRILRAIMESTGAMMAYFDTDFNFVAVNTAYSRGSGHIVEELVGKNHFTLFPDAENQAIFEKVRDTAEPVTFLDKPFEFADQPERGTTYWDWTLGPVKDEGGRVQGLILSLFETTKRKKAEEEARSLARFPDENPNPVMRISKDGIVLYCNDAGRPMLDEWKCQVGQLAPNSWRLLVADVYRSGIKREFEEEYGAETFSFMLTPIAGTGYLNAYGQEVTERRKTEDALLHAKNEWECTFDSMPDLVAILDRKHRIVRANKSMARHMDMNTDDCVGLNCFTCVHNLNGPPSYCPHSLSMADGKEHVAEIHEDRLGGDFMVSTTPLLDKQGQVIGSVHVARDITERKRMEQELRSSLDRARQRESEVSALLKASRTILENQQFQQTAQSIFNCCKELVGATAGYVALLSKDGKENEVLFLDSGGQSCAVDRSLPMPIRGLRAEAFRTNKAVYHNDFSNSEWAKFIPGGHVALRNVLFAPLVIGAKTVGIIGLANKPGGFIEHDADMASAFGELASIALINSRNMESLEDNQKRLKEYSQRLEEMVEERTRELQDSQRLAAIGETAGMVGHDIRNPLQSIEGAVYLAKETIGSLPATSKEAKELSEVLDIIQNQAEYINRLVADLQDFARTPTPQPRETDIRELIDEALSAIEIPENVDIQKEFQENLAKSAVDPVYMKRVLVNLIENAVQAMPNGGNLTLKVFSDERSTRVSVEDTGVGILEENKPKMFTPLFTTKAKGQGFGLPVCRKLVRAHNGDITFQSEAGEGSTFIITLPFTKKAN